MILKQILGRVRYEWGMGGGGSNVTNYKREPARSLSRPGL